MCREHYDACFRYGIESSPDEECNCYEFDRALAWVIPYLLIKLRDEVEAMEHRYPIDIFPELTETDKENLKVVHEMFPNLIGRVDAGACRRQFRNAKDEFSDLLEKAGE